MLYLKVKSFKMTQDESVEYKVTECRKFMIWFQNPYCSNLEKLQLIEFSCSIKEEYLQLSALLVSSYICVKLDILHLL